MENKITLFIIISTIIFILVPTSAEFGPWGKSMFELEKVDISKMKGIWIVDSVTQNYYDKFPNEWRSENYMYFSSYSDNDYTILSTAFDFELNETKTQWKYLECNYDTTNIWSLRNNEDVLHQTMTILKVDYEAYAIVDIWKSIGLMHWRHIEIHKRSQLSLIPSIEETKNKIESYYGTKFKSVNPNCYHAFTRY